MTFRSILLAAGITGLLAIAAGTFGAHGLESMRGEDLVETWEIGVRYHMYHALAILGCVVLVDRLPVHALVATGCFVVGIVLFSCALYALVLLEQRAVGAITPVGGVAFIIGWGALADGAIRGARSG